MIRTALASIALFATLALTVAPARANDSEAEIGIGGITLRPSGAIVMASEDLFISEDIVRVTYRFENPTDRAVTTTIAFPMPPQPRGLAELFDFYEYRNDWTEFGFATWVDGKPVRLRRMERAMVGNRDVTDRIDELGFPLHWYDEDKATGLFEKMDKSQRDRFIAEGLAVSDPLWNGRVVPAWDAVTFFVREQTFPARSVTQVRHEYAPLNGGSVGGALHRQVRESQPSILAAYEKEYCVDSSFIAGVDRRLAQLQVPGKISTYSETWIGYVLSTGANWSGPIGDFRLVIDKGSTGNLVSFCMNGVKKIAPTQFEVRRTDFVPDRDLKILLVKFHQYDD